MLFFAAVTAVALSSCSENEVVTSALDGHAIGFTNYIGTSSKASDTSTTTVNATDSSMGVYAAFEATDGGTAAYPDFMYNQEVKYASMGWTYSPIKYWPSTGLLDFWAYWPYSSNTATADATTASTGPAAVSFTQNDALADMIDFIYATTADQTYNSTDPKVDFEFQHALSRIGFVARPDATLATTSADYSTFITVTGVKVTPKTNKVISNGTLTFSETSATMAVATSDESYHASSWTLGLVSDTEVKLWDSSVADFSTTAAQATTTDNIALGDTDDYIFIVPQTLEKADLSVEVTYTMTTYSAATTVSSTVTGQIKTVDVPYKIYKQGYSYIYPLVIGLDAIEFDAPTVSETWGLGLGASADLSL